MTYGVATTANVDLTGNELGQILCGNAGRNILNGGFGNDTLWGFGGAATLAPGLALAHTDIYIVWQKAPAPFFSDAEASCHSGVSA